MRYLSLLFLVFLSLQSYFVLADDPPAPICSGTLSHAFNPPCATNNAFQSWVNSCISSPGNNSIQQTSTTASCTKNGQTYTYNQFACKSSCSCPEPYTFYEGVDVNGNRTSGCTGGDEGGGADDDTCDGRPKVNGQCPVCPNGFNPDGTCSNGCGAGEIKQGEINGTAICKKKCSDPNQSWGFVNGVEGCYGSPTCPNGGSYGTVNGVPGCYGGDGGGSGSSSGGAGGSSGGSGGDGGSGGNGGSGDGGAGGSGGDGGTGGSGGGSGGGGGGSSNDIGSDFGGAEACPAGKIKQGNKCVSDGRGDCTIGYHELVVSRDPYLFICVKDDPPPASSAASSQPSSNSSQASSMPSSSSASAASAASTGTGSSSGAGGGGGGGGTGTGDTGAGECDPTSSNYLSCISGDSGSSSSLGDKGKFDGEAAQKRTDDLMIELKQKIADIQQEIKNEFSTPISGTGTIQDFCKTIFKNQICFGLQKFEPWLDPISNAIFLVACVLSFYIVLRS